MNRPEKYNAANIVMHKELGHIWKDLDDDPQVRVIIVTGAGTAFCAGGSFELIEMGTSGSYSLFELFEDAKALVHNMVNCSKPIISAINGVAVCTGGGIIVLQNC